MEGPILLFVGQEYCGGRASERGLKKFTGGSRETCE